MAHILVVDDDVDVSRGLRGILTRHGFATSLAESGEQALESLEQQAVDLVILDARMPGLSGFETCARIRQRYGPGLPVLMVTAFGDREAVRQATETGADDLLPKPVNTAALVLRVRSCLRLKSLHDEAARAREEAQSRLRDMAFLHDIGRAMAGTFGRAPLAAMTVARLQQELGFQRVALWSPDAEGKLKAEAASGKTDGPVDVDRIRRALREAVPLRGSSQGAELSIPVRAGDRILGVLDFLRSAGHEFQDGEVDLLTALGGHLALALDKADSVAETARLARQMATLYDVGLETSPLRDLKGLFETAAAEAGRLIGADRTSVLRYHETEGVLRLFAAWTKDPSAEPYVDPVFRMGEGVAGRVAKDRTPAFVNDVQEDPSFVPKAFPIARLLCVPLVHYDREREAQALFGVLNAARGPGAPPFGEEDLRYLTRFASQLAIAVANAMAFAAEKERSEQLALLNVLLRDLAGILTPGRVFETAVRRIHETFHYPVVRVVALDEASGRLRVVATAGRTEQGVSGPELDPDLEGRALRQRRTAAIPDSNWNAGVSGPAPLGRVAVPIQSSGEVVAVLGVASDRRGAFRRGEIITLETLADGMAIVLRNAELYQAVEQTNDQLVELDRTRSELVNIVAHDFRAPLAGMLGYAELLEWRPDAPIEERVTSARTIVEAATHMSRLVEKTLMTSRLETGLFPFEFGIVDVAEVARLVVGRFPLSPEHRLVASIPEDPLPCWADRERLSEVFDNLLSNAVKYSPKGGEVRLVASRQQALITFGVSDQGIGIAPEDLGRLFRPFSRLRNPETADIQGSGLGLYICERIVRAHGGRLWGESRLGEGSTFAFELPVYDLATQSGASLVLVAASDEGTRREVRRAAQEMGLMVREATDGLEAVEAAYRLRPAAVVLDRVLPRLRGEEVARRLRDAKATHDIPLVLLAPATEEDRDHGLFTAHLPKPLDHVALRQILARCLGSPS